jgi:SAM-dependent methyltransferase
MRVNIGCGATPTEGWVNFDNSLAVRVTQLSMVSRIIKRAEALSGRSYDRMMWADGTNIRFANATKRIPCPDGSVETVYSSHMIEHLDRREAQAFLQEVRRILQPGGILRLAIPDLARIVEKYLDTGDADEFVASTNMVRPRPTGAAQRMRSALIGPRNHLWMYDGRSLSKLLRDAGFTDVVVLSAGVTNIDEPGILNLKERADESVYVEAVRPTSAPHVPR